MAADFLNIPGNIRQIYLPFSIAGAGKIQVFSFKTNREGQAVAQIFPFPKTFQQLFGADSGFQYSHGPDGSSQIDYKTFLDQIPSFQIREFVPDARLTQVFKWFTYFKRAFDAATQNTDYKTFDVKSVASQLTEAMGKLGQGMRDLTSGSASLLAKVAGGLQHYYEDKGFSFGADAGYAVLWIPFLLYYRLTTTHTNTIYELPYSSTDPILVSDGTYGWATEGQSIGIAEWLGNLGGIGEFIKSGFGSTIRVNVMPSFDPTSNGGTTTGSTITVSIDLINDSDIAACNNFLFCHTLFGNNRWLQYGFVQASGSLYDVKLPGANRYFMCTGKFKCEGRGAFRSPSDTVVNYIFSCANTKSGDFDEQVKKLLGEEAVTGKKGLYRQIANGKARSQLDMLDRQKSAAEAVTYLPQKRVSRSLSKRDASKSQFEWTARKQLETTITANGSTINVSNPAIAEYTLKKNYSQGLLDRADTYHQQSETIRGIQKTISDKTFQASDIQRELDKVKPAQKAQENAREEVYRVEKRYGESSDEYKAAVENYEKAYSAYETAINDSKESAIRIIAEQRGTTAEELTISLNQNYVNAERDYNIKTSLRDEAQVAYNAAEMRRENASDAWIRAKDNPDISQEEKDRLLEELRSAEADLETKEESLNQSKASWEDARSNLENAERERAILKYPALEVDKLNSEVATEEQALEAAKTERDATVEALGKEMRPEVEKSLNAKVSSPNQIRDLIKIPDVYHITLEFGSLIPDNFNTYLYGFREANLDMFKNYAVGGVDETGVFEELANKLTEALGG